jgi:dihydrofolate reductase
MDRKRSILNEVYKMLGLIVARSKNNVIGKDGKIPWNIKGEQKQFKELTTNNTVIMGRRTYEDIGHPLPNRTNIVISRTTKYEGVITVDSIEKALELSSGNIYIIGGYNLFKEAIPMVDVMYITDINMVIENGDVFFPEFDESKFNITIGEETPEYTRKIYRRKQ